MATYTPTKFMLPNGLDELGYDMSLQRLPEESLDHYRQRLLQEASDPAGASQEEFLRSLNRQVGELDQSIFEVSLILDVNSDPLAADPFIEVTSSYLRAYDDYANESIDFELNLCSRDDAYFLREVEAAFSTSTYFDIEVLVTGTDYEFKRSDHLRVDTTERLVLAEGLSASRSNNLNHSLVRTVKAQAFQLFQNEVTDLSLVADAGDFFIDYRNGVLFTEDVASGLVSYSYREFPYTLFWQPVRAYPANDKDIAYRHKDPVLSDSTGLLEHSVLNSEGAKIANKTLIIHPLGWGK